MSKALDGAEWLAESCDHAARKRLRCFGRSAFFQDSSCGELEAVPAAWNADSRISANMCRESVVGAQGSRDGGPICVEIKHGTDAFDDEEKRTRLVNLNAHVERIATRVMRDVEESAMSAYRD